MSKTVLEIVDHTIELEEEFLPKFAVGTSQYSLLNNRIQSLYTARKLVSGEAVPTRADLEFALPRIESIIHKMSKARDKYEPGSRNYKRFDPTVRAMEEVKAATLCSLEVQAMWLAEVQAKVKRKNQILFSKDSLLLAQLQQQIRSANRRALILWALELAEETVQQLEVKYPEDIRPREAVEAAHAWAAGEIKMPTAQKAILSCHAMAKELADPADIARCHAVGQACSVIHTEGHALGYPMYELTALVLEYGLDHCRDSVESRAKHYSDSLLYWIELEKTHPIEWAKFLMNQ